MIVSIKFNGYIISNTFILFTATGLKICTRDDPLRDECIKNSIEGFLSGLHKKSSLDFIDVEPFASEPTTFEYNYVGFMKGWFKFEDQKNYGMSNVKILKVRSDFTDKEMQIEAIVNFPKLFTTGKYSTSVNLGNVQFEPKGNFNISMYDVTAKWTIKGKLEERNGEDYMNVYYFDVLPKAKNMKFAATGLFDNEDLSK